MAQDDSPAPGPDVCPYFQRTAVIMADGEVISCANFYAENVGHLDASTTLSQIWNGERLRGLRADFGTETEWEQCRSCWMREARYHQQREEFHARTAGSLGKPARYSEKAWSFTRFLDE